MSSAFLTILPLVSAKRKLETQEWSPDKKLRRTRDLVASALETVRDAEDGLSGEKKRLEKTETALDPCDIIVFAEHTLRQIKKDLVEIDKLAGSPVQKEAPVDRLIGWLIDAIREELKTEVNEKQARVLLRKPQSYDYCSSEFILICINTSYPKNIADDRDSTVMYSVCSASIEPWQRWVLDVIQAQLRTDTLRKLISLLFLTEKSDNVSPSVDARSLRETTGIESCNWYEFVSKYRGAFAKRKIVPGRRKKPHAATFVQQYCICLHDNE